MTFNVEEAVFRVDGRLGLRRIIRPALRSELVWRASGLSYATAVIATTGSYCSQEQYLANLSLRMRTFYPWLKPTDSVLEFGCGLGGNLLGISSKIRRGYGVDINPHFIRIANRLKKRARATNISFVSYDGDAVPRPFPVDLILCIGVFERVAKDLVDGYLSQFNQLLRRGGRLILYFLTTRAMETGFGRILGREAYAPWDVEELRARFRELGLSVEETLPHFLGGGDTYILNRGPEPANGVIPTL